MSNAIEVIPAYETQSAINNLAQELQHNFKHDGEKWVIDEANPPTLANSYRITEKILQFKTTASHISDQSNWLVGNIIFSCRNYYGDDFDISQIGDIIASSYNTLITSESVYMFFGDRKVDGLSFTHHKEVHYTADLTEEQKFMILHKAKECGLSSKQTRKLASLVKKEGSDILLDNYTPLEVINALDGYKKETECQYICISFDDRIEQVKETNLTDDKCSRLKTIIKIKPDLEIVKNVTPE